MSDKINPPEIVEINENVVWKLTSPLDKNLEIYFPASSMNPTLEQFV